MGVRGLCFRNMGVKGLGLQNMGVKDFGFRDSDFRVSGFGFGFRVYGGISDLGHARGAAAAKRVWGLGLNKCDGVEPLGSG